MFHPVTEALIDEARIAGGDAVLDVATGSGEPALSIAEVVGPAGLVVGIDPFSAMLAAGERAATDRHFLNARFQVASADHLPFETDAFDAVVSRFGIMFFPSPVECVREMLRVLKPNRPIAFAVWSGLDNNPFHYCLVRIMDRFSPEPQLPPDAPGPFRFATPGKLRSIVEEAGARDVTERLFHFSISAPLSPEDFWDLRCDMAEKLRKRIAALPTDVRIELKKQALDAFRPYAKGAGVSFPGEALIVSGRK
jgi:SAM-dependent methyltransferase